MVDPSRPADESRPPEGSRYSADKARDAPASFGNVSEHHWSRAREGTNSEAMAYYRQRSKAPGVAEGGSERNFYCMECDGVISHDHSTPVSPHCGASLEGASRRYFNWVEIDKAPSGDAGPLLRRALLVGGGVTLLALALWAIFRSLA